MFTQEYYTVFPFVRLLRRLLADGCPITAIHIEIAHMEADGDIKFPHPREQLPAKWVLVELKEVTPHGRKLMIVTGGWDHPIEIDPISISCCERLPPPKVPVVPPKSYAKKLAAIEAYQKTHDCSADAAYEALHGALGHSSGEALKIWMFRNRPT